jgi:RNA polymerase primary sigma factor
VLQARSLAPRTRPHLESYLRDINGTPLLDAGEERDLAWRVDGGDPEARDHLVRANLRLVVCIASGYAGRGVALEDLIAEGNLGLMRAAEGFDPSLGLRFSTYATFWIKQSVRRALQNTGKTVRLPSYVADLLVKWRRASAALREELGRVPEPAEVAEHLGLSAKKLKVVQKAIRAHGVATREDEDGPGLPLHELPAREGEPCSVLEGAEEGREVLRSLDQMEPRQATVLRLRFGLDGGRPMILKEVGKRLGLTRERVRQIEGAALAELRGRLATQMGLPLFHP